MAQLVTVATISYVSLLLVSVNGQLLEGIYCGKLNCYDILDVNRESSKNEIAKNYRKLAKKYHPDLYRGTEEKLKAEEQFKVVANAYEILKDDEARADYDYMLDHPDEYYANYYRYYRRKVAPKVDVRLVIFVTISVISVIHYYSAWQRYEAAIKYFVTVPKYRNNAVKIAEEKGIMPEQRKSRGKSKSEVKEEIEMIIRTIIEENMDIKGAYAKPTFKDVLWIKLFLLPFTIIYYFYWYLRWFILHTILQKPYTDEEKLYLIRKNFKMGEHQFNALEDEEKQDYLDEQLWIREKFQVWFKEKEEEEKKKLAERSAKYKQYRRYIKNHGVGRMTFDDS